MAKQLSGLVHDNEGKLAPTLEKLNSVTAMLEKNRDNIAKALPGLAKYQITLGEAVSSMYDYSAFIPNAAIPNSLSRSWITSGIPHLRHRRGRLPVTGAADVVALPVQRYSAVPWLHVGRTDGGAQ